MEARERRSAILQLLRNRTAPVTGGELAARMGVSRQVIVQDIALLRTGGSRILATPEGYVLPAATLKSAAPSCIICVIVWVRPRRSRKPCNPEARGAACWAAPFLQ